MSVFGFFVFDRRVCLYRKLWDYSSPLRAERQETLLHGLIFSLKRFCSKISEPLDAINSNNSSKIGAEPFETLSTPAYKLHFFESLTGYKFIYVTEPNVSSLKSSLKEIYETLFVPLVVLIPRFKPEVNLIQTSGFPEALEKFTNNLNLEITQ